MTMRALLASLLVLVSISATAQELACPPGNLLHGMPPSLYDGVYKLRALTDGSQPHEGAFWNTDVTGVLASETSFLVYDLRRPILLNGLTVQADNNDTLEIYVSRDGERFDHLWTIPAVDREGMRSRQIGNLDVPVRFIRIGGARGDGFFSIGEVQAFCQMPSVWPPMVRRVGDPAEATAKAGSSFDLWWMDREHRLSVHKIAIGFLALLAFLGLTAEPLRTSRHGWLVTPTAALGALLYATTLTWGIWPLAILLPLGAVGLRGLAAKRSRRKRRRGKALQESTERAALTALLLVGALAWSNFLTFHGSREVHLWDFMHYYMGSKYFSENDYRWLYHCALLAELDDGRLEEVKRRKYRNLKDNRLGPHGLIVGEAEEVCRARFSDARWQAFRQDLRVFRDLMSPGWFKGAFEDHGYNASPAWNMIGTLLSNWRWEDHLLPPELVNSPANLRGKNAAQVKAIRLRFHQDRERLYREIQWLARIDAALYAGIFGMIIWAFGLRGGALAIMMWSIGHPWAYYWTGGSFGRVPWLFTAVASLCLMKKGYNAFAGAGIAWSFLLRAFPAVLAGGVGLKVLWNAARERRVDPAHLRLLAGALAATAVIAPLSMSASGGFEAYTGFVSNSLKHRSTPLTNHMGLQTIVSYDPRYSARHMKDPSDDPFAKWKKMRRTLLDERTLLVGALGLGMLFLLGYAVREMENWEASSLSTLLIFGLFELTGYYTCFLILLAPFCTRRISYVVALMGMAIGTQLAALSTGWEDERAVLQSVLILGLLLFILGSEARAQRLREVGNTGGDDA
jgi:hypothetical protein